MLKNFLQFLFYVFIFTAIVILGQGASEAFECQDPIGCVTILSDQPIKIGVLQAFSGRVAQHGEVQSNTIELVVAQRKNQLLGHPIQLLKEDEKCSPESGRLATLKIIADPQVAAIFGPTCSGTAVTASKVMSEKGLVMISGQTGAASLTSVGGQRGANWQPGFFRTIYNTSIRGTAAAAFVFHELKVTKVATIDDGGPYNRGNTNAFHQAFQELGGEIVLRETVNREDTDMRPVLTAVVNYQAQLVFFSLFEKEGNFFIRQAKEMKKMEKIVLIGTGPLSDAFIQMIGSDGQGVYFPAPAPLKSVANDELISQYKAKYGNPPSTPFYSYAYDATNLLFNALETVAVQDNGTTHIGRQALRDAMYQTQGFPGVTGTLICSQYGDCGSAKFVITRLLDSTAGVKGLLSNTIYTYSPDQITQNGN